MVDNNLLTKIQCKVKVLGISSDTRHLKKGDVFFAINGKSFNGTKFIDLAIKKGAVAIVLEKNSINKSLKKIKIPIFLVKDIRASLSEISISFYKSKISNLIAVTGTNGKTSVAFFLYSLLKKMKKKSGLIGTLGTSINKFSESNLTTPDSISISKILRDMTLKKINYVVMEASSHGLDQKRLHAILFDIGILTNITHDHLDYHKTEKHYINSKLKLFNQQLKEDGIGIINKNTNHIGYIKKTLNKKKKKIYFFGEKKSKFYIVNKETKKNKTILNVRYKEKLYKFKFKDFPFFQIENCLMAIFALVEAGFSINKLRKFTESLIGVPGRMQLAGITKNDARVFIDFAHTPDALTKILIEAKKMTTGKVHVLFGCGGNRDKGKRLLMGKIALKYSNNVIVTDDNPRFEEPSMIRKDIIGNLENILNFGGRKKAIEYGIKSLEKKDILIIAGKGHEKYQIIKNRYYKFDDLKIAKKFCK